MEVDANYLLTTNYNVLIYTLYKILSQIIKLSKLRVPEQWGSFWAIPEHRDKNQFRTKVQRCKPLHCCDVIIINQIFHLLIYDTRVEFEYEFQDIITLYLDNKQNIRHSREQVVISMCSLRVDRAGNTHSKQKEQYALCTLCYGVIWATYLFAVRVTTCAVFSSILGAVNQFRM